MDMEAEGYPESIMRKHCPSLKTSRAAPRLSGATCMHHPFFGEIIMSDYNWKLAEDHTGLGRAPFILLFVQDFSMLATLYVGFSAPWALLRSLGALARSSPCVFDFVLF